MICLFAGIVVAAILGKTECIFYLWALIVMDGDRPTARGCARRGLRAAGAHSICSSVTRGGSGNANSKPRSAGGGGMRAAGRSPLMSCQLLSLQVFPILISKKNVQCANDAAPWPFLPAYVPDTPR